MCVIVWIVFVWRDGRLFWEGVLCVFLLGGFRERVLVSFVVVFWFCLGFFVFVFCWYNLCFFGNFVYFSLFVSGFNFFF